MSNEDVQPALLNAFLLSTKDSLMVLEAARRGICPVVTRRLHDREKSSMIRSGAVFAFDETATGIKRWTDGSYWSPSRIIGNYLVYREIEKKGDGEGTSRPTSSGGSLAKRSGSSTPSKEKGDPIESTSGPGNDTGAAVQTGATGLGRDLERALVGSLTSSYKFKKNGLVKKTISNGSMHLISYYSLEDVVAGRLRTPSSLNELASLEISPTFLNPRSFRAPPFVEVDSTGNLRYVGEEQDPISAPPTLAGYFHNRYGNQAPPPSYGTSISVPEMSPLIHISEDPMYAPERFPFYSQHPPSGPSSLPSQGMSRPGGVSSYANAMPDSSLLSRTDPRSSTQYPSEYSQPGLSYTYPQQHEQERTIPRKTSEGSLVDFSFDAQQPRYTGGMPGYSYEESPAPSAAPTPPSSTPPWSSHSRTMTWRTAPPSRTGSAAYPYPRRRSELDLVHAYPSSAPDSQGQQAFAGGANRRPSAPHLLARSPPLSNATISQAFMGPSSHPFIGRGPYGDPQNPQAQPYPYPAMQSYSTQPPPSRSQPQTSQYAERSPVSLFPASRQSGLPVYPPPQENAYTYPQTQPGEMSASMPEQQNTPYLQEDGRTPSSSYQDQGFYTDQAIYQNFASHHNVPDASQ